MNLLTVQGKGALLAFCILLICIGCTAGSKLVKIGWRTLHKKLPPQKPPREQPEPVYYIVEKQTRPAKTTYKKPKKIQIQSGKDADDRKS